MSLDVMPRKRAPIASRKAREFLRNADPVLAGLIDARPGFRPRAWMDELPVFDGFGTLVATSPSGGRFSRPTASDHVPSEEEIAEVSDRWRPYRSLAVSYLFASEYGEEVG